MKNIIKTFSLLASVLLVSGCSNDGPNPNFKISGPVYFGDKIYFEGENEELHIDELNKNTSKQLLSMDNYSFSFDGEKEFEVKDSKNKVICTVKGTDMSDYNIINIDTSLTHFYEVKEADYSINITTSDKREDIDNSFALVVLPEITHAIHVTFTDANIDNKGLFPIICSYSYYAVNVEVKGDCILDSGTPLKPEKEVSTWNYIDSYCSAINYAIDFMKVRYHGILTELARMGVYALQNDGFTVNGYVDYKIKNLLKFYEDLHDLYDFFDLVTGGQDGPNGLEGCPAIIAIGALTISGNGNLTLSGGNGGTGGNGLDSLVYNSKGGNGGDATYTIAASKILIHYEGRYQINKGIGGYGGRNGDTPLYLGLGFGDRGKDSDQTYKCDFIYRIY